MPWLKFRIRKGFRYTNDTDFLIFLQIRARGGSRTSITFYSREFRILNLGFRPGTREYSDVEGHPAYHCRLHNHGGVYDSFDYKRALRSDRHEERLCIQYKICSCLSQKIKTAQVR